MSFAFWSKDPLFLVIMFVVAILFLSSLLMMTMLILEGKWESASPFAAFALAMALITLVFISLHSRDVNSEGNTFASQRAQLVSLNQEVVGVENTLYREHNRYTTNLALDVYPTHPEIAALVNKSGFSVNVEDNSILQGQAVLVTIIIPSQGSVENKASEFQTAIRDGVVVGASCSGYRQLGCINGKWFPSYGHASE